MNASEIATVRVKRKCRIETFERIFQNLIEIAVESYGVPVADLHDFGSKNERESIGGNW